MCAICKLGQLSTKRNKYGRWITVESSMNARTLVTASDAYVPMIGRRLNESNRLGIDKKDQRAPFPSLRDTP